MEITISASTRVRKLLASPNMLVVPSMTIYIDDEGVDSNELRKKLSTVCLAEGIMSYRLDGELVDVVESAVDITE